ncbi:protein NYNRIN-like isoform X2 [Opisthocomus hoazin]
MGFAVMTDTTVLIAGPLPLSLGAQGVEVVALTEGARYAKGKKVSIYTESKYAFGVCHATGALWKERGFLTSAGKTIAHGKQIKDLLEAIQLLTALAVIYIKAHTGKQDAISRGNHLADQAARAVARHCNHLMAALQTKEEWTSPLDVCQLYESLTEDERSLWERLGAQRQGEQWILNNKPLLPTRYLLPLTRWFHEKPHGGPESTASQIQRLWAAPGIYAAARRVCENCKLFKQYATLRINPPQGKRPPATFPFQKLQTDYAEMPKTLGYAHLLVTVDQLSGWVEAFPTRKYDSKSAVKIFLKELIP